MLRNAPRYPTLWLVVVVAGCTGRTEIRSPSKDVPKIPDSERFSVKAETTAPLLRIPLAQRPSGGGGFERLLPAQTGVDFVSRLDPAHPMRRIYYSGYACGGVAVGDVDNDGRADLYLVNGAEANRLYRQVGDFEFEDVTTAAGVDGGDAWGAGAALVDIDNDFDLDIYVCNYDAPNQLYVNQGDGRFVESAAAWGLDLVDASLFPAFGDIDRDGDLDLYLLTNRYRREGGRPASPPFQIVAGKPAVLPEFEKYYALSEVAPGRYDIDAYGRDDYLLVNNGQGRFEDRTKEAGIVGHGDGLSATWWDYDADGWPDLYVANDFNEPDRLYRNNGNGTFTDQLLDSVPHTPWFSMGSDAADLDNNGQLDLFVLDMSGTNHFKQKTTMGAMSVARLAAVAGPPPQYMRNALLLNAGRRRFMEVAYLAGLANTDWSWAVKLADFDNDGRVDVFVTNGTVRSFNDSDVAFSKEMLIGRTEWDIYQHTEPRREQNLAFHNDGDLAFSNVSQAWGLDHVGISYGAAWGDLDRDGDLDLIVANVDEPISIYRNNIDAGHRVTFRLVGRQSNRFGLGATIVIQTASGSQLRELSPLTGFLACNQPIAHFGLGPETTVEKVTIRWPTGGVQTLTELPADHHYIVSEPVGRQPLPRPEAPSAPEPSPPMFVEDAGFPQIVHADDEFDDFAQQPLLPNKLSQFGPGMAWGDVDSDGDSDLFLGGGSGHPGQLWIHQAQGTFQRSDNPCFAEHAEREDLGALFVDVDGDLDLDLYVVSGGTGDGSRQDRLYLNQGLGQFRYDEQALPKEDLSGSVVVAGDYDRDGDLDLFVGSRVVPGSYPLPPRSQLLRNDKGTFTDATPIDAPQLAGAGMVTGAVWSDANGDGWRDLLVTYEWGPVRLFVNQQGTLRDATQSVGLATETGWWNGIASGDIDNDGDIDYVATNFGLNTKYHASHETPTLLYYGDFDQSGRMQLIEAEYEDERLFPVRGKSCSTQAMPFLRDKFPSYKDFALADLAQIYTDDCLKNAHRFAATTLESCVLLNEGERFRVAPLPRLAQNSPAFGVALLDADADGCLDLYVVQNFYGPQPETGRMDGGLSLLMRGNGAGGFTPVWPSQSGLIVPGDAKSLAVVDLNEDAWPDLVTASHRGPVQAFLRSDAAPTAGQTLEVRLQGTAWNRAGIGSTVVLHLQDGTRQTREIQAGSGYLSQSPPVAFFAFPPGVEAARIEVRWPDGSTTWTAAKAGENKYLIDHDSAPSPASPESPASPK